MSLIQNYPDSLLDLHHHWHLPSSHPGAGPGRVHPPGTAGAGLEFLQFHRDFVASFHQWYDAQPAADQNAVRAWHAVPAELKVAGAGWTQGWADAETRLQTNSPAFQSADELGAFIELGIHNQFLHGAAALVYNEPTVSTFHSPLSTYFYQIHGLVEWWWQQWEANHNLVLADTLRATLQKLLGGAAVDGGGIAITPSGRPKPVDPWSPKLANVTTKHFQEISKDMERLHARRE